MLTIFMCKMFLSFLIDFYVIFFYWNISMNCKHFIFIGYLLMLTYFHVENVPEFQYCCWLFTDVDYFPCTKCYYHSRLMFMWFSCTETYQWIANTSSSLVFYWCWHILMWKMFQNFNIAFDYLLMLTIFHVQNSWLMFMWFSCTEAYIDELHALHLHWLFTDVDMFSYGKCSRISTLLLIIYWCWLFFMCKMFLSFSIDVYVIFLYWNISMNCMHFIFIGYLLMLTYFCIQYCFWLFTDVDYFSCAKCSYHSWFMFMWICCTEIYPSMAHTSSSLVIYWCW